MVGNAARRTALAAAFAIAAAAVPAAASTQHDVRAGVVKLPGGESAQYAAPTSGTPKALVVFFHGQGHNGYQYAANLIDTANKYDVLAVAMITKELPKTEPNYRGPFQAVEEEARGAAAVITWARTTYKTGTNTYLFATSMGGAGLAYFVDSATRSATGDKDAQLVQAAKPFPVKGIVLAEALSDLTETWAGANLLNPTSKNEIEADTGGTPLTKLSVYRSQSMALLSPAQWKQTGAPVAAEVHDVDDGLVPYDEALATRAVLGLSGMRLRTYDVVFETSCGKDVSTFTGYASPALDKVLCLAGHADETDRTTGVMGTAFEALGQILEGSTGAAASVVNLTHP